MEQLGSGSLAVDQAQPASGWPLRVLIYLVSAVVFLVVFHVLQDSRCGTLPIINGRRPLEFSNRRIIQDFVVNGHRLLRQGLERFNGQPFKMLTDHGPTIILPPSYAHEIRNLHGLSHARAVAQLLHANNPGFEAFYEFAHGNGIVQEVVASKVTQSLGTITAPLSEETASALGHLFTEDTEWHAINLHESVLHVVARVSSRLFLGDRLCRDPDWLRITTSYTRDLMLAVFELNAWPSFLRPVACRFLRRNRELTRQVREARRVMSKVLDERRSCKEAGKPSKYTDAVDWFEEVANGRKYDPVHVQLTLSFVAIHTTADLVTQVLFDIARHPEYIQPLREEIVDVLGNHGWKRTSFHHLKLLDSVLKESQRLKPIKSTSMQRLAVCDVRLSDGTIIPRNSMVAVASTRHWDFDYYHDPYKFDGRRFLKMRSEPGKDKVAQFASTSPDHLGFGHGQHACPGRFFASDEIKIILCHLLLKYDWRLVAGQDPKISAHGFFLATDTNVKLQVRRRREELDIDRLPSSCRQDPCNL